jgi:hypothetical protein
MRLDRLKPLHAGQEEAWRVTMSDTERRDLIAALDAAVDDGIMITEAARQQARHWRHLRRELAGGGS